MEGSALIITQDSLMIDEKAGQSVIRLSNMSKNRAPGYPEALFLKVFGETPSTKQRLHALLARMEEYFHPQHVRFVYDTLEEAEHFSWIETFVQECLLSKISTYVGSSADTLAGIENLVRNAPAIVESIPNEAFVGILRNKTVFIVGSGPSSDSWTPFLREMKDRAVIIGFDSSFRQLHDAGIEPDILCSIERCGVPSSFLERIPQSNEMLFIGPYTVEHSFAEKGNRHIFYGKRYDSFLAEIDRFLGLKAIDIGITVANLALGVALQGKAETVVLFGIDLAYLDEQTHTNSLQMVLNDDIQKYYRENVTTIEGISGEVLKTLPFFKYTRDYIEKMISDTTKSVVLNTSMHGARIEGTLHIEEHALRQHMEQVLQFDRKQIIPLKDKQSGLDVVEYLKTYKVLLEQLVAMESISLKTELIYNHSVLFGTFIHILNRIYREEIDPMEINRLANEIIFRLETAHV